MKKLIICLMMIIGGIFLFNTNVEAVVISGGIGSTGCRFELDTDTGRYRVYKHEGQDCQLEANSRADWSRYSSMIKSFIIESNVPAPNDMTGYFAELENAEKIDLSAFVIGENAQINGMFENIGANIPEGTVINLNKSFKRSTNEEFDKYKLPGAWYYTGNSNSWVYASYININDNYFGVDIIPGYRVCFEKNGGDNSAGCKVYRYGTEIDTTILDLKRSGYELTGFTDTQNGENPTVTAPANGKSKKYASYYNKDSDALPLNSNSTTTLFAQWIKKAQTWTVKWDLNGGKTSEFFTIQELPIEDGYKATIPAWDEVKDILVAPTGKVYDGVEIEGKHYYPGDEYIIKSNITVKLLWKDPNNNNNNQNNNQENNKNNKDKKDSQKQEDANNPQTGDNISNYIWILLISLTGIISGVVYLSKNKLSEIFIR